jgi:hypothetical protein
MTVRHQKCNAMAASAGTKQCSQLELLIVIDNAVAKQLRNSLDSLIVIDHLVLPSESSSRGAVSNTYHAA